MRRYRTLFVCLLTVFVAFAHADEHRQHGDHRHGTGKLNIVLQEAELQVELDSPAVNLLGFEHHPNSSAEHQTLSETLTRLQNGIELFVLPDAADCKLVDTSIDSPFAEQEHADHSNEHQHEHAAEHDKTHADISASWQFTCTKPEAVLHTDVRLFEIFPGLEQLLVQYIIANRQGGAELNPTNSELKF